MTINLGKWSSSSSVVVVSSRSKQDNKERMRKKTRKWCGSCTLGDEKQADVKAVFSVWIIVAKLNQHSNLWKMNVENVKPVMDRMIVVIGQWSRRIWGGNSFETNLAWAKTTVDGVRNFDTWVLYGCYFWVHLWTKGFKFWRAGPAEFAISQSYFTSILGTSMPKISVDKWALRHSK